MAAACTAPPPETDEARGPLPGPSFSTGGSGEAAVLRLATTAPASLDPRELSTPDSLLLASQIFDGLVAYDPVTLDPVPAAAERWEVLDGGKRFVFHLRQRATFHDGDPVRAEDFIAGWNGLADPLTAAPFAFLLEQVEGFEVYQKKASVRGLSGLEAVDDGTLQVTLARPWPDFVSLLGHPALSPIPPAASGPGYASQPVGNGPYRVASPLATGSPFVLQGYQGYYGVSPPVQTVEVRTLDDPEQAWPEFVSGDLDVAPIPPPLVPEAKSSYGGRGIVVLARFLYCAFNEADPRFQDPSLRLAASLAVDRQVLADQVYAGLAVPASGIVPPSLPGHRPDVCGDLCRRDVDRARDLVGEIPRKDRAIALDYAASPIGERLASTLADHLGEAGLRITPRGHDEAEFASLLRSGEQEMYCLAWPADYPRQQALLEPLLLAESPDNRAGVNDPRLNDLLAQARDQTQEAPRQALYAQAEQRALGQMHLVPLVWFRSHLAVQTYVDGFALDPLARFDASTLSISP